MKPNEIRTVFKYGDWAFEKVWDCVMQLTDEQFVGDLDYVYLFSAYEVDEIRDLRTLRSSSDGFIQKSNLKLELNVMILKELERQKKSQT